ncbi:hypothetical protein CV102_00125 [Natronococcus pandeyae]|uniref:Uncharacterized protein n=1 Tax=Natronococcus pandeyae TaxID=2055836 RepID=A0A8J8TTS4_9EURY|nr:hypothetical protein CV102_00125 [Natronococcus pandeyae]
MLATGATLGSGSVAGCFGRSGASWDGFVQLKALRGIREGEPDVDLVRVSIRDRDDNVGTRTTDEYETFFDDPSQPTVDEETHSRLERAVSGSLRYVLGICQEDPQASTEVSCRNTRTTRESFNRVQVFDGVEAELSDDGFDVLESEPPSEPRTPDWA